MTTTITGAAGINRVADGADMPAGSVLQVVSATKTDTWTYTGSLTFQDVTGLAATITPVSASSKIMVQVNINFSCQQRYAALKTFRGSTQVGGGVAVGARPSVNVASDSNQDENSQEYIMRNSSYSFLDSPNTTSATTYKVQAGNVSSTSAVMYVNRTPVDSSYDWAHRGSSTITLMEIAQ